MFRSRLFLIHSWTQTLSLSLSAFSCKALFRNLQQILMYFMLIIIVMFLEKPENI